MRQPTKGQALPGLPSRWRLRRLRSTLRVLLTEPQQATYSVKKLRRNDKSGALGLVVPPIKGVWAFARGGRSSSRENQEEAEFTATKMESLHAAVVQIRSVLDADTKRPNGTPTLVVLDDFYHVPFDDQPEVLAYLR